MDVGLLTGWYFTADDVTAGSDPALITEDLWNHEFGRATDIVGRSLLLGDVPDTIVGVRDLASSTTREPCRPDTGAPG